VTTRAAAGGIATIGIAALALAFGAPAAHVLARAREILER